MSYIKLKERTGRIELKQRTGRIEKAERQIITARDTEATYFDKNGILQTAAPHEIRYSKNFETGKQELLLEDESTNLIHYSENYKDSSWQKFHVSLEGNQLAPDGTNTAFKVTSENENYKLLRVYTHSFIKNRYFTGSFFIKNIDADTVGFRMRGGENLPTFSFVSEKWINVPASYEVHPPEKMQSGWYRLSFTDYKEAGGGYLSVNFTTSGDEAVGESGVSMLVWGAQLEEGQKATSYIPTSGEPVTRPADKLVFAT